MAERLIVGISGASGAPIAVELLTALRSAGIETHLVVTDAGAATIKAETGLSLDEACSLASVCYDNSDIGAIMASGSFKTGGMIVAPCSMKTAAGINSGYSDNLLLRAADVTLKEQRRLVLAVRESPLSQIHLRNLYELSQTGATILPPVLSYYNRPLTIEDATRQAVGKILDQFGVEYPHFSRWLGDV
jgi:4-hydroxy-3-polyprenylbenzoate decarboxylase